MLSKIMELYVLCMTKIGIEGTSMCGILERGTINEENHLRIQDRIENLQAI